jgi:hypothetical protein
VKEKGDKVGDITFRGATFTRYWYGPAQQTSINTMMWGNDEHEVWLLVSYLDRVGTQRAIDLERTQRERLVRRIPRTFRSWTARTVCRRHWDAGVGEGRGREKYEAERQELVERQAEQVEGAGGLREVGPPASSTRIAKGR